MILSLCLLLPALSPSSQEICSAPGDFPAPVLRLSLTSARPGESVSLKCSMLSQHLPTRVVFCKEGEEVSSQRGSKEKATYNYNHVVSGGSSRNYTCGYEIKDSDNQVNRSQLSPAQHLSLTGDDSSSGSVGGSSPQGPDVLSIVIWTTRCILVLLLLVSAPVITFMLEKWSLTQPAGLKETREGSVSILRGVRGQWGIPIDQL
nr:uncharacterized protein LOC122172378 [Chrysemys picta bellii]